MELGDDVDTSLVENKIAAQKPHQCALLIYTVSCMPKEGERNFFFNI